MIATLFAFALTAAPAPEAGGCSLEAPEACRDAGMLVRDPEFQAALKAYVGTRNTSYLGDNGRAGDEDLAVLGGPVHPAGRIGGFYLFTGCRTDACDEAGAAVLEPDGQFAAVAILHTNCAAFARAKDCFLRETLSIFTDKDDPDEGVVNGLTEWARRQVQINAQSPGAPITHLEKVELIAAARRPPGRPAPPKIDRPKPAPASGREPVARQAQPPASWPAPEPRPEPKPEAGVAAPQPPSAPPSPVSSQPPSSPEPARSVETPAAPPPKAEPAPQRPKAKPAPKPKPSPPPQPEPAPAPAPSTPPPAPEPPPPPKPTGPTSVSGVDVLVRPTARVIVQPSDPVLPPTPVLEKPPKVRKRNFHPWLFRWNRGN